MASSPPTYVVLEEIAKDTWRVIGEVERKPGQTARVARARAIETAAGGSPKPGVGYRAVLRSEWRIAAE